MLTPASGRYSRSLSTVASGSDSKADSLPLLAMIRAGDITVFGPQYQLGTAENMLLLHITNSVSATAQVLGDLE